MDSGHLNSMFYGFSEPGSMHLLDDATNDLMSSNDMISMFDMNFEDMPMNINDLDLPTQSHSFSHLSTPTLQSTNLIAAPDDTPRYSHSEHNGAGPSPPALNTGVRGSMQHSTPPAQNPGALTEFTKRRNWPAKVIEELKDIFYILDANSLIKYVSPIATSLTGYEAEDIVGKFLKEILHPDDVGTFTSEMNECIATGNPLRIFYRLRKKDQTFAIFEAVGHAHIADAKFAPNPHNLSPFCQAVFLMSRPYPTRNALLLDSFLEHKVENERLRRRISELRREEDEEEASQSWIQDTRSDMAPSDDIMGPNSQGVMFDKAMAVAHGMMPAPANSFDGALTRENVEGAAVGNRQDSIGDKMARYEGTTFADPIEMLTGLRYVEGERSRAVNTGVSGGLPLIKGDIGIAIPVDRDPKTGEKKKKLKVAEEYVCTDCGTLDSPEWRKGPSGPKTLCNACGLRWAKKEKKKNANGPFLSSAPTGDS